MITEAQLTEVITKAKEGTKKRKFKQSIELIINFKDIESARSIWVCYHSNY